MAAGLQVLARLARVPLRPLLLGSPMARLASGMALAEQARQLFESAVGAVLPGPMLHRTLSLDPGGRQLKVRGRSFQLRQNLYLVGFGKAVLGMAAAAEELLGQHLVQGVVSVPRGISAAMEHAGKQEMLLKPHSRVQVFEGAEDNLPDRDALRAALAIRQLAEGLTADDLLLVLISGVGVIMAQGGLGVPNITSTRYCSSEPQGHRTREAVRSLDSWLLGDTEQVVGLP